MEFWVDLGWWWFISFLHTSHSRHSVRPRTLHSSCPRLLLDLIVQRLLHMSHSVWAYTNNLLFFTFQPYSWTLLCIGSYINHNLFDIPFTFPIIHNPDRSRHITRNSTQDGPGRACVALKWHNPRWRTEVEMVRHATWACHGLSLVLAWRLTPLTGCIYRVSYSHRET